MKIRYGKGRWWGLVGSAGFGLVLLTLLLLGTAPWGETAPFGIRTNGMTETNISLVITNGESTNYYEIYVYDFLGANSEFVRAVPGGVGQTNFTIDKEGRAFRFFKAAVDQDWDKDGIINVHDADPRDTNYKALTITIESPAHGSTVQ